MNGDVLLTCGHCGKTSQDIDHEGHAVRFRDTAFLIICSAFFGNKRAETDWPVVCDLCWQKFRERFQR